MNVTAVRVEPVSQSRSVVRKRTFEPKGVEGVVEVLKRLMDESHTGPVTIYLGRGGIRSMQAEDKAELPCV